MGIEHDINQTVVNGEWKTLNGSWETGKLDIGDIQEFDKAGDGGTSSAGAVIHETVEQLEKAKLGLANGDRGAYTVDENGNKTYTDYNKAHSAANEVEDSVNGNTKVESAGGAKTFTEKDGTTTTQTIQVLGPKDGGIKVTKKRD